MHKVGVKRLRSKTRDDRVGDAQIEEVDSYLEFMRDDQTDVAVISFSGRTMNVTAFLDE
ncbi:hypothetical protein [Rhizobium phage RHph_X2_28B]|uniref:hypothetical protein n=1 Tax=Rhizobium phage RHph_X2_28B TaxID=2836086 RepID=UPI00232921C8|nr:hypothetical protein PP751_gp047 [Rhizobium phage RHph_X2_28B]QWY83499.1 hypothetical protein [Rhizobium phage RHph_X2_28B]QWY83735.1 hypothetical protein [Rhizobium phage RHph_X3_15]